jgi:hypothetical protein
MGEGFVKLFSAILDSSVWSYDAETRIVWITLLAMSDADGLVHAAVPGIARRAGVSLSVTQEALKLFQEPDEHSRSDAYDGRRIERQGRDWLILNFKEHRARQVVEAEKARKRKWWRENRGKDAKLDAKLADSSDPSIKTRPIPEAEADPKAYKKKNIYSADFENWYSGDPGDDTDDGYPWKTGKMGAFKVWKTAKRNGLPDLQTLKAKLKAQKVIWAKDNNKWVPKPKTYLEDGCYDDELKTTEEEEPTVYFDPDAPLPD